ncbi:MAG: DUF3606 domain-containing protein [Burkholderiales bacterium]
MRTKQTMSAAEEAHYHRVNVSDLESVQRWARELEVSVVELLDATRFVGTWIPAVQRHLRRGSDYKG